jgi:hypothetical protein
MVFLGAVRGLDEMDDGERGVCGVGGSFMRAVRRWCAGGLSSEAWQLRVRRRRT